MAPTNLPDTLVATSTNGVSAPQPDIEIVDVNPALAREWMRRNKLNRNIRDRRVQQYAADMATGDWRWTGESIKFDHNGNLIDGQHRLSAVIKANVAVKMLVIRGLEAQAQEELDQGVPRQFHDVLSLRGEKQTATLSAVIRKIGAWDHGTTSALDKTANNPTSVPQMLRILEAHPELRQIATTAHDVAPSCGLPASLVGLLMWVFGRIDAEDSAFFFARLADGQRMEKGDPIYELRRALADLKQPGRKTEAKGSYLTAITIKAWNAFREGRSATNRPVGLYRFKPGGAKPEQFPVPI